MPARVEGDLNDAVHITRPVQHLEECVDAERVPFAESDSFTRPIPRLQRLAPTSLDQKPAAMSGTEAVHPEQELVVAGAHGTPQVALSPERRAEGFALPGSPQLEGLSVIECHVGDGGIPESGYDGRIVLEDWANPHCFSGRPLDRSFPRIGTTRLARRRNEAENQHGYVRFRHKSRFLPM